MMQHVTLTLLALGVAAATPAPRINTPALDNVQINEDIISKNGIVAGRSEESLEETFKQFINQDMSFTLPMFDSPVTINATNLDDEGVNLKLKFSSDTNTEGQARKKSKIKKIFIPILVLILLKAITLIPLALGVLGIKTWNAIQLSFISFVSAIVMAVWKLCAKVNHEPHPQIIHNAWDPHHHHHHHDRSDAQQMAYSAYEPQNQFAP